MNTLLNKTEQTPAKTPEEIRRALEARVARLEAQTVEPEITNAVALREGVANHVFAVMQEQGITQAELARRLGKSRAYVCKILGGGANLTLDSLTTLGAALECDLHVHLVAKNRAASTCTSTCSAEGISQSAVKRKTSKSSRTTS